MIHPLIPTDKLVFIHVLNRRRLVSRYVQTAGYEFEGHPALNWEALEPVARWVVEDRVGAITEDGHFPCPEDLAARAEWPPEQPLAKCSRN